MNVVGDDGVPFEGNFPVFDRWSRINVEIQMRGDHYYDFKDADAALAKSRGWMKDGVPDRARVAKYRKTEKLTWHHHQDGRTMQLVPRALNSGVSHVGGASTVKSRLN
jgi:hypothetical protein